MVDFTNHTDVTEALERAKDADRENREKSREAHAFLDDRDGQWEQRFLTDKDHPRYTFEQEHV